MIYIHPVGGLGNMLFHIASIYSLAKDNGDELSLLNIDKKITDLKKDGRIDLTHASDYKYIFDRFKSVDGDISIKSKYPFEFIKLKYSKEHEYLGYFQSEGYFIHRRKEILELFKPSDEINDVVNKYENLFGNIGLHVRRNDYVKMYNGTHPPQSMDYYNKALEILTKDLKVVIFSDDIKWCKENFIGDRYHFIDEIDYISLYLMSKMKHNIIANSSFSWWGAWLSEYQDKTIIAPKNWFGGRKTGFDLKMNIVPKDWIRL